MIAPGLQHPGPRACLIGDARRVPKLPHHDQQHPLVEPPGPEVFDQRGDRLVERREPPAGVVEDVAVHRMAVPVVDGVARTGPAGMLHDHVRETGPRLHQPAGQQGLLSIRISPIAIPQRGVLAGDIERPAGGVARQQAKRLLLKVIARRQSLVAIELLPNAVKPRQQPPTVLEPGVQFGDDRQVGDGPVFLRRVPPHQEWFVGLPQVAGSLRVAVGIGVGPLPGGEGEHFGAESLANPVHDAADRGGVIHEPDRRLGNPPRQHPFVRSVVVSKTVRDRANQREAVGELGVQGEQFAHLKPRDPRGDRREVAAVLEGGVRLEVVGVEVREPACQPDQDDGGVGRGRERCRRGRPPTPDLRRARRQAGQ